VSPEHQFHVTPHRVKRYRCRLAAMQSHAIPTHLSDTALLGACRLGKMQKDIAEAEDHCKRLQKVTVAAHPIGAPNVTRATKASPAPCRNLRLNAQGISTLCHSTVLPPLWLSVPQPRWHAALMHHQPVAKIGSRSETSFDTDCRSFLGLLQRRTSLASQAQTMTLRPRMCRQPLKSTRLLTSPCSALQTKSTARYGSPCPWPLPAPAPSSDAYLQPAITPALVLHCKHAASCHEASCQQDTQYISTQSQQECNPDDWQLGLMCSSICRC